MLVIADDYHERTLFECNMPGYFRERMTVEKKIMPKFYIRYVAGSGDQTHLGSRTV